MRDDRAERARERVVGPHGVECVRVQAELEPSELRVLGHFIALCRGDLREDRPLQPLQLPLRQRVLHLLPRRPKPALHAGRRIQQRPDQFDLAALLAAGRETILDRRRRVHRGGLGVGLLGRGREQCRAQPLEQRLLRVGGEGHARPRDLGRHGERRPLPSELKGLRQRLELGCGAIVLLVRHHNLRWRVCGPRANLVAEGVQERRGRGPGGSGRSRERRLGRCGARLGCGAQFGRWRRLRREHLCRERRRVEDVRGLRGRRLPSRAAARVSG
mmetsp:Transcript_20771/g.66909  ORF Transcript_20771/g.66909 Transcript_20771/m.66909 type:complete len:273 (+) Transcript_20771:406-1224(+)